MVMVAVKAAQSAVAVLAGILTNWWLGDGNLAKLLAVGVAAVAAMGIEYALAVAPKRSRLLRRLLDRRAVFEGVWLQDVKKVFSKGGLSDLNTFAIFTVTYYNQKYAVEGRAYDESGKELARWKSNEPVHFSSDDHSMTYLWSGTYLKKSHEAQNADSQEGPNRMGFGQMTLTTRDAGNGRIDHVAEDVMLVIDIERVTPPMVSEWRSGATPDLLRNPVERDRFAVEHAKRRIPREITGEGRTASA
jgi:hypothetical protein